MRFFHYLRDRLVSPDTTPSLAEWIAKQSGIRPNSGELIQQFWRGYCRIYVKHERLLELRNLLEENFLPYTGATAILAQVVT